MNTKDGDIHLTHLANKVTYPPGCHHFVDEDDERQVLKALRHGRWSNGECVAEFEKKFACFCGTKHALFVINCTAAVKLALVGLNIGPGDEVIVPGMTWASIPLAVIECGATPVAADIDPETYCLSASTIEPLITHKTKAAIATHLYNSQVDMAPVLKLCQAQHIDVIEDTAHSAGAQQSGKCLGTFGIAGVFSFNQKKLLSCGEGGCLVTDDSELYATAKRHREIHPEQKSLIPHFPSTLIASEFQAGLLISQLKKLPEKIRIIEENGLYLTSLLDNEDHIQVIATPLSASKHTFYGFCFRVLQNNVIENIRATLQKELGFPCMGVYPPPKETVLFQSLESSRYHSAFKKLNVILPNCNQAQKESIRFHYRWLLGNKRSAEWIAETIIKTCERFRI